MRFAILVHLWISVLACLAGTASAQELQIDEARGLSFQLIASGQHNAAADLAGLLTQRDPEDQAAWLALAQAESGRGNADAAVRAARRAWALADNDGERFSSSIVASQTLLRQDKLTRAQFWLRRAVEHAPNEAMKARAVRDFRFVRANNPLTTRLNFAVVPSTNINNGAKSDRVYGGTLTGSALALSGIEYQADAALTYSFPRDGGRQSRVGASLSTRSYTLSDAARATSPASRNGDFAFQELELSYGTAFTSTDRRQVTDVEFKAGGNRNGGADLSRFAGVVVQNRRQAGENGALSFGAGLERIDRLDFSPRSATVSQLFGGWSRGFGGGQRVSLNLLAEDTSSADAAIDHERLRLSGIYSLPEGPMGTAIDFSLSFEGRDYNKPLPLFGLRQDRTAEFGVTVTLQNQDYYGFVPTIGLTAATTSSTVDFYDSETLGIRLGLRSAF